MRSASWKDSTEQVKAGTDSAWEVVGEIGKLVPPILAGVKWGQVGVSLLILVQ
jgi:hypothetical protein